jgi:hypothetical protein
MMRLRTALVVLIVALGAGAALSSTVGAATKYPTSVKKFYGMKKAPEIMGRIGSPKSKCLKRRKVSIFMRLPGKKRFNRVSETDKTNSKGKFKIAISGYVPVGVTLYAKIDKKRLAGGSVICLPTRNKPKRF